MAVALAYHWLIVRPGFAAGVQRRPAQPAKAPHDASELARRIAVLESAPARKLQRVGFVRFNTFADAGSVRTYAKAIRNFAAEREVSGEEQRALDLIKQQALGDRQ